MDTGKQRRLLLFVGICMTIVLPLLAQTPEEAIGFWKTIHDKEGFTTSIMAVYEYQEQLYGRIIVSFDEQTGVLLETHNNPKQLIETITSRPRLLAVDIFWGLQKGKQRWKNGTILDPRTGRTFTCDCFVKDGNLIIRGRVGPFGLNSVFLRARRNDFPSDYDPPDLTAIVPNIPSN